jgi:hypothetical protein
MNDESPAKESSASRSWSPLSPAGLLCVLLKPSQFFSKREEIRKPPEVLFVTWLTGISYFINRLDLNIMKADLRAEGSGDPVLAWLTDSWLHLWPFLLVVGAINAVILWYVAGWWYRKRLQWSGAVNPDPELARTVYVYQDLVQSAPVVLSVLVQTVLYSNYLEAWRAQETWGALYIIFAFWSCATSYKAAMNAFPVSRPKARMWFLILPAFLYAIVLGVGGTLIALWSYTPSNP